MGIFKKMFGGRGGKHLKGRKKSQKEKAFIKSQKKVEKQLTFTKVSISFVLINSELQIWASYVLAFLGKDAISEALSQQIVITIIGTMMGYFIKSLVENLSKYTTLFGKNLESEDVELNQGDIISEDVCIDENSYECKDTLCDGMTMVCPDEDIEVRY